MSALPAVLVVDDDEPFRTLVTERLARKGYRVVAAPDGERALGLAAEADLAVVDLVMPGMDGLELLGRLRERRPEIEVLLLTGHGTVASAVAAMKAGAADFLQKPCTLADLEHRLGQVWERTRLRQENLQLREALQRENPYQGIVGRSAAMRDLVAVIRKVKDGTAPVLVLGESGTGKELVARALHFDSTRRARPFVALNCATLQEQLLESELFGHKAGAFTGAVADKRGLLETAEGGTLFVDEVAEAHPNVQAKLLRVLETGEYRAVGDVRERRASVRVVAATNRDLAKEVSKGRFREDLYYRLNVVTLRLPPLRERGDDAVLLARAWLSKRGRTLAGEAAAAILAWSWPGNVRELFNTLERALLFDPSPELRRVPMPGAGEGAAPKDGTLEEVELAHIRKVLDGTGWNVSRAAEILGTSRRNLHRKIARHGLSKPGE